MNRYLTHSTILYHLTRRFKSNCHDSAVSIAAGTAYHKLPRIYHSFDPTAAKDVVLSLDASHYLTVVMRLKIGQQFRIFNELHGEFVAQLKLISKKSSSVTLCQRLRSPPTSTESLPIILSFALIKKPNLKLLLSKATELGVSHFQPIVTQNTNMELDLSEPSSSWSRLLIESAEQCERLTIPTISPTIHLAQFIEKRKLDHNHVVICRERQDGEIDDRLPIIKTIHDTWSSSSSTPVDILCGPEGGFTKEEFTMLTALPNRAFVSLGPTILRAETAAVSAISCAVGVRECLTHSATL